MARAHDPETQPVLEAAYQAYQEGGYVEIVEAVTPLLADQIRAECWTDCTEAEPCGYCQHGHRRGRRDAAEAIREHARTTGSMHPDDAFLLGLECAARIAEGKVQD